MYLIVLALATFLVWEAFLRPLVTLLFSALPIPDLLAGYSKALSAVGTAVALDHWVDERFLIPLAAASAAGALGFMRHASETPRIAVATRSRARRGMPMPGP